MRFAILTSAAAITLASCGGGSSPEPSATISVSTSSPTPMAKPTATPTAVAYSIQIKFVGGGTSFGASSSRIVHGPDARTHYTHVLDTSVNNQEPIEMAVQATAASQLTQAGGSYGEAEVDVSPAPSTQPTILTSATGAPVITQMQTNNPNGFQLTAQSMTPISGLFTVNLSGSVTGSATAPIYEIPQTLVACGNRPVYGTNNLANSYDQISSVTFASGTAASQSTNSSDLYMDGPNCTTIGTVNASESEATFHFPYGATLLSSLNTPFSQLSASQFSNSFTSITYSQLVADITAVSIPPNELIIQTASGNVVKIAPFSIQSIGNEDFVLLDFGYQQTGFSIDGF